MKRFTQTAKWADAFFRELSPAEKLAYLYLFDNTDNAGVWDPDYRLANFCIGAEIEWDDFLARLGNRVLRLRSGKWFLTRFIPFQYGKLTPICIPHKKILDLLEKHGIELALVYRDWNEVAIQYEPEEGKTPAPRQDELPGVRTKRERDLVFEALVEVQGADISRLTVAERGRLNKAAATIREVEPDVTPDRIRAAAKAWRKKGYSAPATASVLASRWSELTNPPPSAETSAELTQLEKRLEELSEPSGKSRVARADLTGPQRQEYERLAGRFSALSRKTG